MVTRPRPIAAARKTAKQKANEFAKAAGGTTGKPAGKGIVKFDG